MGSNSILPGLISQEASAQGVPPSIALAVATQESGIAQYTKSGSLVTGAAGEVGVFQLMPATAAMLGVDPSDPGENIQGGISFLAQLYAKYGNWAAALSAYNSGSPTASPSYANSVLALAGGDPDGAPALPSNNLILTGDSDASDSSGAIDPNLLIVGGLAVVGLALWWMAD